MQHHCFPAIEFRPGAKPILVVTTSVALHKFPPVECTGKLSTAGHLTPSTASLTTGNHSALEVEEVAACPAGLQAFLMASRSRESCPGLPSGSAPRSSVEIGLAGWHITVCG